MPASGALRRVPGSSVHPGPGPAPGGFPALVSAGNCDLPGGDPVCIQGQNGDLIVIRHRCSSAGDYLMGRPCRVKVIACRAGRGQVLDLGKDGAGDPHGRGSCGIPFFGLAGVGHVDAGSRGKLIL